MQSRYYCPTERANNTSTETPSASKSNNSATFCDEGDALSFCRQAAWACQSPHLRLRQLKLGLETNGTNPAGMIWLRGLTSRTSSSRLLLQSRRLMESSWRGFAYSSVGTCRKANAKGQRYERYLTRLAIEVQYYCERLNISVGRTLPQPVLGTYTIESA
jgi:hypothetical protein